MESMDLPGSFFRVVVLGSECVGKTSLVSRFVNGEFPERHVPTVHSLYERSVNVRRGFSAFLEIQDTAGLYDFPAMQRLAISQGDAFVLVYSVRDGSSLEKALELQEKIYEVKGRKDVPMIFVGNKCDLATSPDSRRLAHEVSSNLIRARNCVFADASAKFDLNVDGIFTALLGQIALANFQAERKQRKSI